MQQPADPGKELCIKRLVEAELRANAIELFRRRIVTCQNRGWVAGRQAQQQEHEQRDHAHDGNGG